MARKFESAALSRRRRAIPLSHVNNISEMDEDLADYVQKLKVSDDLFKDIKFYATGKIPDEVGGRKGRNEMAPLCVNLAL